MRVVPFRTADSAEQVAEKILEAARDEPAEQYMEEGAWGGRRRALGRPGPDFHR